MTETHPATEPPFFVSCNQGNSEHQADVAGRQGGDYLCYINGDPKVPDPSPGTLRADFYSSETDGDRDRRIPMGSLIRPFVRTTK